MMLRLIKRQHTRGRKGQGLLEFALITPVLLLLLMGTIEFGWLIFNYTQIYNGLREGLRYGSVPSFSTTQAWSDCSSIRHDIEGTAPQLGIADGDITITYDDNAGHTVGTCSGTYAGSPGVVGGDRIVIEINHKVHFLTPFLETLAPSGWNFDFKAGRSVFCADATGSSYC